MRGKWYLPYLYLSDVPACISYNSPSRSIKIKSIWVSKASEPLSK